MPNFRKWSTTASGNATIAGGASSINWAEQQLPSTVNNSARETLAQLRSLYKPSEWGWVEHSATASIASQTTFKIASDVTADYIAGRRTRIYGGSTIRYGDIVSSAFAAGETTVTITVDSGSLSASMSIAALSTVYTKNVQAVPSLNGVSFPAVQVSNAGVNVFDDYEEGTFTPRIDGTTVAGLGTYTVQVGRYTKIGNRVYVNGTLTWTAHTGTGDMIIAGLPFTTIAVAGAVSAVTLQYNNLTYPNPPTGYFPNTATSIILTSAATGAGEVPLAIDAAATIRFAGCYETAT